MRIAILSDLHVSRYGDTNEPKVQLFGHWFKSGGRVLDGGRFWSNCPDVPKNWKIQRHKLDRHWRALDATGIRRAAAKSGEESLRLQVQVWATADATERAKTSLSETELRGLLAIDPDNTNLRLLQVRRALDRLPVPPDWLCFPGDLTDNGYGYEFITSLFADWFQRGRAIVVPGNHDLNQTMVAPLGIHFEMEPRTTTREDKAARFWPWYRQVTKREPFPGGCSGLIELGENAVAIGLDRVRDLGWPATFHASRNAIGHVGSTALAVPTVNHLVEHACETPDTRVV
jgi:hypothetical protein